VSVIWEQTFDFSFPVAKVWSAFLEIEGPSGDAGTSIVLTDSDKTRLDITEFVPESRLTWDETKPDGRTASMATTFEATDTGTRVTIVRSGFGEGDDFEIFRTSHMLGWREGMADLAVYLATGFLARRHLFERCALGIRVLTTDAGLLVVDGGTFGLEQGDVIVSINGAAIYGRSDLWLLTRLLEPGSPIEFGFVRDGVLHSCAGETRPVSEAVVGELGLGPREREAV
jgi:hypothetical protein